MKSLNSIGTELKQWQLCPEDEEVSLINHSNQSAFKKFKQEIPSTIIRANYHPLNMNHVERSKRVDSSSLRDSPIDNYLTSDKNHFAPIFKNGDFFTPDDRWDAIPYERSESGSLQYKNKTYHVWKVPSNCSATGSLDLDSIEDDADDSSKLTIKFALNDNNKSVQTEEGVFATNYRDSMEINEYCRRKIYDEYSRIVEEHPIHVGDANKWRQYHGNDDSNDYSFFSVNRVKSNNNNNLMPLSENVSSSNHSSSSSICTITSALDAFPVDPFDSWRNVKVENINAVDMNVQYTCKHSCWENCVNCAHNTDEDQFFKPMPASRLLKDELRMDGDEIMNVIQNLYITNGNLGEDESEDDGCVAFDVDRVVNIIGMDDSIDGIEPLIEDERKFYETSVDFDLMDKCQKKTREQIILENFDENALVKYQQQMDRDRMARLIQTCQDANNNVCSDVSLPTNNRKRRHSTCQNYLEKKRYFSHEEGFSHDINPAAWTGLGVKETAALLRNCLKSILGVNDHFLEPSKMVQINVENVFLIADPCLEMEYLKNQRQQFLQNGIQDCGANYYRNILQHQHALVKHLDLSRPLTR